MTPPECQLKRLSDFQSPVAGTEALRRIGTELIDCTTQIRSQSNPGLTEESLRELGQAMKAQGQLQPVLLRPHPNAAGRFLMIAGERRLRAAQLVHLPTILARVFEVDDAAASRLQRAENTHREALTQLEQAEAVVADYNRLGNVAAVAAEWGKSEAWVSQARAYVRATDSPSVQLVMTEGLTSDKTTITSLAKLEARNPQAANEVVQTLRVAPNANARQIVNDALKPTAASGDVVSPGRGENATTEVSVDALLEQLYTAQFTEHRSVQDALKIFSDSQQARIEKVLRKHYQLGQQAGLEKLTEAVVRRARRGDISGNDSRLYRIVAFLEGARGSKSDTLADFLQKAAASRGLPH